MLSLPEEFAVYLCFHSASDRDIVTYLCRSLNPLYALPLETTVTRGKV